MCTKGYDATYVIAVFHMKKVRVFKSRTDLDIKDVGSYPDAVREAFGNLSVANNLAAKRNNRRNFHRVCVV